MTVIGNHVRTVSNELLGLKRRDFLFIKILLLSGKSFMIV